MMHWSNAAVFILRTGWLYGDHARDIAAALSALTGNDVTRNAVIGKADRLELGPHPDAPKVHQRPPPRTPAVIAQPARLAG